MKKEIKKTKRFLAGLLSFLLVVTAVPLYGMEVQAQEPEEEYEWEDNDDNGVTITSYKGEGGDVKIPSKLDGKSVTSIRDKAFIGCSGLTSITIPEGVTSIGSHAFRECNGLKSVTIPASVTRIDAGAFSYCSALTSITVDVGNKVYDSRDTCNAIIETASNTLIFGCKNTNIPGSVTRIGTAAFSYCSALTSITIPDGVVSIGYGAFEGSGLTSVTIPASVEKTEANVFYDCKSLKSVTIQRGLAYIEDGTFHACEELTSITIPDSVTQIREKVFADCEKLTSITIPNSVTEISDSAFLNCRSLKNVTIPASVTSIGSHAFGYTYDDDGKEVKISGFTIYGVSGSAAQTYANKNGFTFKETAGTAKKDISKASVTLSKTSYTYDGKAKTPAVTVVLENKTLKLNTDYTVSYSNNVNAGTANVTVTGKGNYTGSKTVTFTIKKETKTSITCKKKTYSVAYGAKPFKIKASSKSKLSFTSSAPKVASVNKSTGQVTIKGTGTAVITVKAGNNSVKVTVKVSPKKPSVKSVKTVKGKKLTVTWAKDKKASGYQVQISTDKNFKKNVKSKSLNKTSYTFTKLKANKKYYVRIRSYKKSGKDTLNSSWSAVKRSGKIQK